MHTTGNLPSLPFIDSFLYRPFHKYMHRALTKTLSYLQTKRPDLEPKPGFLRQLHALDQSLQRVTRANARGKDDAAVRKSTDWNPNLILS